MYNAFNLKIDYNSFDDIDTDYIKNANKNNEKKISNKLQKFIVEGGKIDSKIIEEDWFPDIKADIFISHSHKDENLAIQLQKWLYDNFNLTSFVDSTVWKYSRDLLNLIISKNEYYHSYSELTYKFNETINISSHIDMILSTSLIKMIDKCECLFFLNTPESINEKTINNEPKSYSQWIYLENYICSIIKRNTPIRYNKSTEAFFSENIIVYSINTKNMIEIISNDLCRWLSLYNSNNIHPLDILYTLKSMRYRNN